MQQRGAAILKARGLSSAERLALFREVCAECPRLTSAEIRRLEEARRYGQASGYARQWLLASLDMQLSMRPRPPIKCPTLRPGSSFQPCAALASLEAGQGFLSSLSLAKKT